MKMVTYLKFELISSCLLAIFNFLIITDQTGILREVYTVLFISLVPGALISFILRIHGNNFWEKCIVNIGLSISTLLFGGLLANFILPLFFISKPLTTIPLLYFFNVLYACLIIICAFCPRDIREHGREKSVSVIDVFFMSISFCFPLLATFGAISLNNGGSNILTIILLTLIALLLLAIMIFEERINEHTYYWYVFTTSVSLLLMLSLRSTHISGSDINEEFRIFQLTQKSGFWNPYFIHAYNACISLTILPTIIAAFTRINNEYIYKVVMQVLFSLVPVAIYCLYRNFTNKNISLLAVFYIICQPFFIQPMTSLIRQEVALFFFVLALWSVFNRAYSKMTANLLFIIFGISVIVSHYSTAYITMGLFTGSYILIAVSNTYHDHALVKKIYATVKALRFSVHITHSIQAIPLFILIVFTYFWFFQFTQTSGNLTIVLRQSVGSLQNIFKEKHKSNEATKALSLFSTDNINSKKNIDLYAFAEKNKAAGSIIATYPVRLNDYPLYPVNVIEVHPLITSVLNADATYFLNIMKLISKLIVFFGPLLLFVKYFMKDDFDREYILLTVIGILLVGLVIVHPTLGEAYNLSRIYLHILFVAALGGILFISTILYKVPSKIKNIVISSMLIIVFSLFSGLSAELIGGTAYLHLHNYGDDYDKFYTHDQEVAGAKWLAKNYDRNIFLYADNISNLRLQAFGNITTALPVLLPVAMYRDSYVYARYANVVRGRTDASIEGSNFIYSFPTAFLNKNKNLIYSNGGAAIYR